MPGTSKILSVGLPSLEYMANLLGNILVSGFPAELVAQGDQSADLQPGTGLWISRSYRGSSQIYGGQLRVCCAFMPTLNLRPLNPQILGFILWQLR